MTGPPLDARQELPLPGGSPPSALDWGPPFPIGPLVGVMVRAAVLHPTLWLAAVAASVRLARPGWWRRWPLLPLPDAHLWHFRVETAYGGAGDDVPSVEDVRSFLRWCRDMHRWRKV